MFLDDAVRASARAAALRMEERPEEMLEEIASRSPEPPRFSPAIRRSGGGVRLIAEFKRSSPSAGRISDRSPGAAVRLYEYAGATAASVITSEYGFDGSLADLERATKVTSLPVLRKDFITVRYQLFEARVSGASAVLLIAAALDRQKLSSLLGQAESLGLDCLVECHREGEVETALEAGATVIGINNRDLVTLEVDPGTTGRLLDMVPDGCVVVSESGIKERGHVIEFEEMRVDALLVGEVLMRSGDPVRKARELLGEVEEPCGSRSAE